MKVERFVVLAGPLEYDGVTYRTGDEIPAEVCQHTRVLELIGKIERRPRRRAQKVTMEMRADDEGDNAAPYNTKAEPCESG